MRKRYTVTERHLVIMPDGSSFVLRRRDRLLLWLCKQWQALQAWVLR